MQIRNSAGDWGAVQKSLHWIIVLAVIVQLAVGFTLAAMPSSAPSWARYFPVHTSLGLSIFLLMLARLLWRASNPGPVLPATLPAWQRVLARSTHWLFYLVLLGLPVSGYLAVSAGGHQIPFYGAELPQAVSASKEANRVIMDLHVLGATLLILLIALHAAGALRHEWLLHDNVLRRMLPFVRQRQR